MRIATWNLQEYKLLNRKSSEKLRAIYSVVNHHNPDIIILTESSTTIKLEKYPHYIHSTQSERVPDDIWASIWTKYPILATIEIGKKHWGVCGIIDTPKGKLIVYGLIIPYRDAGRNNGKYGILGSKLWELHQKAIHQLDEDIIRIRNKYPKVPIIVAGDFNQHRDGRIIYCPQEYIELLTRVLSKHNMTCLTDINLVDQGLAPKSHPDHICVSNSLIGNYSVGAWLHKSEDGIKLSDHIGIFIDF
jgi:hypothetical protein